MTAIDKLIGLKGMTPYKRRAYMQGAGWVDGDSMHEPINNECTPDFSCCMPKLFEKSREKRLQIFNRWCDENGFPKVT